MRQLIFNVRVFMPSPWHWNFERCLHKAKRKRW